MEKEGRKEKEGGKGKEKRGRLPDGERCELRPVMTMSEAEESKRSETKNRARTNKAKYPFNTRR